MKALRHAVIMAGGLGTRLAPLTNVVPKPLLPVGGQPVLELQLRHLRKCGIREVTLALNYKAELFRARLGDGRRLGLKLRYSIEDKPLGTAGPLTLLADRLHEPFLLLNGDILTDLDARELWRFHCRQRAQFTIVCKRMILPLHYGVVRQRRRRITGLQEKPNVTAEINAGIYVLDPSVTALLAPRRPCSMDKLIRRALRRRLRLFSYLHRGYWTDIGQREEYERAQRHYRERRG